MNLRYTEDPWPATETTYLKSSYFINNPANSGLCVYVSLSIVPMGLCLIWSILFYVVNLSKKRVPVFLWPASHQNPAFLRKKKLICERHISIPQNMTMKKLQSFNQKS